MPGHTLGNHGVAEGPSIDIGIGDEAFVPVQAIDPYADMAAETEVGERFAGTGPESLFFFRGINAIHPDS